MKTIPIFFIAILALSGCRAQIFTYGPKIGVNFPSFRPEEITTPGYYWDYNTSFPDKTYKLEGGSSSVTLSIFLIRDFRNIFLQFEPTYFSAKGTWKAGSTTTQMKITGIEFPLLIGKKINLFRVFAGIAPNIVGGVFDENAHRPYYCSYLAMGYTIGLGLDISKIVLSIRYMNAGAGREFISGYSTQIDTDVGFSQILLSAGVKLN